MPMGPRAAEKMTATIPPVRLTAAEKAAVDWMIKRHSARAGVSYSIADMVRVALAGALREEVVRADGEKVDVPESVRNVL